MSVSLLTKLGEMSEWLKEPVLKTGDGSAVRGFESRSLLHKKLNIESMAYMTFIFEKAMNEKQCMRHGEVLKRPKRRPC